HPPFARHFKRAVTVLAYRIDERLATLTIDLKGHSDMTCQMPIGDEFSQSGLVDSRRLAAHRRASKPKVVNDRFWSDQEPDSQKRNNVLAEVSDVDDSFVAVEALQTRDRACSELKFTEVIVLHIPCILPT